MRVTEALLYFVGAMVLGAALVLSGCTASDVIGIVDRVRDDEGPKRPDPTPVPTMAPTPVPTVAPPPRAPEPPEDRCDGPGGFLWKPYSEGNHRLVILLPSDMGSGNFVEVRQTGQKGKLIETGVQSGIANGNREHHRFNRDGAYYEREAQGRVFVLATTPTGERKGWAIPNGGNRCD